MLAGPRGEGGPGQTLRSPRCPAVTRGGELHLASGPSGAVWVGQVSEAKSPVGSGSDAKQCGQSRGPEGSPCAWVPARPRSCASRKTSGARVAPCAGVQVGRSGWRQRASTWLAGSQGGGAGSGARQRLGAAAVSHRRRAPARTASAPAARGPWPAPAARDPGRQRPRPSGPRLPALPALPARGARSSTPGPGGEHGLLEPAATLGLEREHSTGG